VSQRDVTLFLHEAVFNRLRAEEPAVEMRRIEEHVFEERLQLAAKPVGRAARRTPFARF